MSATTLSSGIGGAVGRILRVGDAPRIDARMMPGREAATRGGVLAPAVAPVLEVEDLEVRYGTSPSVRGIGLRIAAGESVALVGESGCGKSTTALAIAGLLPQQASASGRIAFEGEDLLAMTPRQRRRLQGSRIGMIFQEPLTSLNPVLRIGEQIMEVLRQHEPIGAREARRRAGELLDRVGIPRARQVLDDYPHHLSGGQRQRVMIAIAIACGPRLLIADEPTTALDMTTQASTLALLDELRSELGMALLLITHDLGVVSDRADRVLVMHDGRVLESATTARLFSRPAHPYTRGLLGASLRKDAPRHHSRARLDDTRVPPRRPAAPAPPAPARRVAAHGPPPPLQPRAARRDPRASPVRRRPRLRAARARPARAIRGRRRCRRAAAGGARHPQDLPPRGRAAPRRAGRRLRAAARRDARPRRAVRLGQVDAGQDPAAARPGGLGRPALSWRGH